MATNADKICKLEIEEVTVPQSSVFDLATIPTVSFESELDDIEVGDIPDKEEIENAEIVEYEDDSSCNKIFTDDEILNLKKKALSDGGKDSDKARTEFVETYKALLKESSDALCEFFVDGNITGEDSAEAISNIFASAMQNAKSFVDSTLFKETAFDKLYKAVTINNASVDGCISEKELITKTFESSNEVLSDRLTQIKFDTEIKNVQLAGARIEALINKANEKIARFKSSDKMLELQIKAETAKLMIEISQAVIAEYEASEDVLNIKMNTINYQKEAEKSRAEVAQFQASEEMLGLEFSTKEAQDRLAKFEASDGVISLKQAILQAQHTELGEKIKQIKSQILLVLKQKDGFSLDTKVKMFNVIMDGWKTAFASGGLEEVPAIISQNNISEIYHELLNKSDAFNGGTFFEELRITNIIETDEDVTLELAWNSGLPEAPSIKTILDVSANYDSVVDYPKSVLPHGTETFTIRKPSDNTGGLITMNIKTTFKEEPKNEDGTVCCELSCPVEKIKSSELTYSVKPKHVECSEGWTYDEDIGRCVNDDTGEIAPLGKPDNG